MASNGFSSGFLRRGFCVFSRDVNGILRDFRRRSRYLNVFSLAVAATLQCFLACEEMEMHGDFVPSEMGK